MEMKMHGKQQQQPPPPNRGTLILCIFLTTALLHCKYSEHTAPAAAAPATGAAAAAVARRMMPTPVTLQSSSVIASAEDTAGGCSTKTEYVPSEFELSWMGNVTRWQDDFCSAIDTPEQAAYVATWLNTLQQERAAHSGEWHDIFYDPKVFSKYVTRSTCDGSGSVETVTWIEPLAHGLRWVVCGS
jgi:hypothetical protein